MGEAPRRSEGDSHSRVQVRAADVAERVNHRQHDEAKSERDACMGDGSAAGIIDDDRASSGKDEGERAEEFSEKFLHAVALADAGIAYKRGEELTPRFYKSV